MTPGKGKLLIITVILAVLLFALAKIFVHASGNFFRLELAGFLGLLLLSLIGFVGYNRRWGAVFFFLVFTLYLINLVILWHWKGELYAVLVALAVLGWIFSFPRKSRRCCDDSHHDSKSPQDKSGLNSKNSGDYEEPKVEIIDDDEDEVDDELEMEDSEEIVPKVEIVESKESFKEARSSDTKSSASVGKHSPGKYVASARSNIFHEPKCDWAKKIAKERRVWFKTKKEAWDKSFKAHSCVQ
ncbi:MAG TPA: hypothetical protein VJC39_02485 [Candidatus Nanoarchaeia archaeon]|nr:hypothetical protein [Candidatus Nanoarchaeia archaeon]